MTGHHLVFYSSLGHTNTLKCIYARVCPALVWAAFASETYQDAHSSHQYHKHSRSLRQQLTNTRAHGLVWRPPEARCALSPRVLETVKGGTLSPSYSQEGRGERQVCPVATSTDCFIFCMVHRQGFIYNQNQERRDQIRSMGSSAHDSPCVCCRRYEV